MQRTNIYIMAVTLGAAAALTACPSNDANQDTQAEDSTDSGQSCNPGEQTCECNNGLCFADLECVDNICVDPDCTPGSEQCPCADGNLCLGDLECINGVCSPPGDGCTPMAYFHCSDGDVYWFDSCMNQGALKEDCDPVTQNCVNMGDEESYCVPKDSEYCPDGMIGPGEDCEGANLGGQTCETLGYAGGDLSCTDWCTFDESNCVSCGNGEVDDPSEDCDGADLQGANCQSFNFTGGDLQCSPNCTFDMSGCTSCDCASGACCENGCDFSGSNVECDAQADTEYGCPAGTAPGADVSARSRAQYCSGVSDTCNGALGQWESWQLEDNCGWDEYCTPADPTCNQCQFSFAVTQYECNNLSFASGNGLGGGEIFEVCTSTNSQTGYMTVTARKMDDSTFGNRPYQVRVSEPNGDPCGPNTWFFVVADSDPTGIGTSQLSFSFPAQWEPDQWEKAYCVTASTQFGDLGYDGNNPQQQSWWYSKKSTTTRDCN